MISLVYVTGQESFNTSLRAEACVKSLQLLYVYNEEADQAWNELEQTMKIMNRMN